MTYSVKEIFYTIQGEGLHTGRSSVFCRFSGCNLWNGREEDRKNAKCRFFEISNSKFSASERRQFVHGTSCSKSTTGSRRAQHFEILILGGV